MEEWVAQRAIFCLRIAQSLHLEPTTASFLLPVDLPGVARLKQEVKRNMDIISLCNCDAEYLEVSLQGSWVSDGSSKDVGVFVTTMNYGTEFFLYKLWQESEVCGSLIVDGQPSAFRYQ
ncbi:alr0857 family protein [Anabaena sp. FACHB-1237]|uniref:alr0857 family protein n=1 Tax=Anabaena sp. FACHB-1237 TaxID=2692769 RepID=UPI0018F019A7|nr:alr0857 family protein [Anabaena sp. FACHB-1237]